MYELVVELIGTVPVEFEFIYGLVTMVACIFGIVAIFSPIVVAMKLVD